MPDDDATPSGLIDFSGITEGHRICHCPHVTKIKETVGLIHRDVKRAERVAMAIMIAGSIGFGAALWRVVALTGIPERQAPASTAERLYPDRAPPPAPPPGEHP